MTEEKQGAAEWLRGIIEEYETEKSFNSCSLMAKMLGIECGDTTCRECTAEMMKTVADRIESERAIPEGIEWPRFEDGELVKVGDEVECDGDAMGVVGLFFEDGKWRIHADSSKVFGFLHGKCGERVKRPTPKVLGADGVEIRVGDTVYCDGDPEPLVVDSFDDPGYVYLTLAKNPDSMLYTIEPSLLTHKRPDSWERLEEDAAKRVCEYAGAQKSIVDADRYTCLNCPYDEPGPHTDAGCNERMRLDLVRRAKALAKAGEQG